MAATPSRLSGLGDLEFSLEPPDAQSTTAAAKPYHLADGIVLSIGPRASRLMDLIADDDIKVDFRYIEVLERLGHGVSLAEYASMVPLLLDAGVIEPGSSRSDPYIRDRLTALDEHYLADLRPRLGKRAAQAYEACLDVHSRRKRFFQQVGQCPVLPETALRRALLVGDAEDVGRKNVLCLGDDDLVSVALAALGHEVSAYDIDDYLLEFLRRSVEDVELPVTIEEVDLRDPLAKKRRQRFDVVLTDPMSNRDCFDLFLSRALSMLKPDGVLFSACFAPAAELFEQVVGELGLSIHRWHARHNRYYTHFFKQHWYASDWVELRLTERSSESVAPDDFSVPLNLYREDFYQRLPIFVADVGDIEDEKFTRPMYLDLILDLVEANTELRILDRAYYPADEWSLVVAFAEDCRLTIHTDRARKQILIDMFPFVPEVERVLRGYLMSVFKPNPQEVGVATTNAVWSVRIR
ncbi:MAG: bis-aminopropyl spermidine synthase family protein [Myxococcota bacterium]